MRFSLKTAPAIVLALAIGFFASVTPALLAARVEKHDQSLPEQIFESAFDRETALKTVEFENRSPDDYPRIIDLYRQVVDSAADPELQDKARMRMADLTHEMALRSGDAVQFLDAVDIYRTLVIRHPDSPYVSEALIEIAEIYEYELQDVDGATAAWREISRRFPQSVSGREAGANLARLDPATLGGDTGTDIVGTIGAPGAEVAKLAESAGPEPARVINLRTFSGPDYARIVVDLNHPIAYHEKREGTRIRYILPGSELSNSLLGRRLSTPRGSIVKQMQVEQFGDGVQISLELSSLDNAAAFLMDDPSRLIIDLRGVSAKIAGSPNAKPVLQPRPGANAGTGKDFIDFLPAPATRPDVAPPPPPEGPNLLPPPPEVADKQPIRCIVIDPGHGGHDTGTIGPGGLAEKDVALDIARRLRASLRAELPGVEIILTRDNDRYITLEERTAIANARNADLFISIHANASQSSATSGIETYVLDPNAVKDAEGAKDKGAPDAPKVKQASAAYVSVGFGSQIAESRKLAGLVQGSLVRGISAKNPSSARDRGIKHASFAVLRGARMPSILAEVSFVSNPDDENRLRTPGFRQRIASALTSGIRAYVRKNSAS